MKNNRLPLAAPVMNQNFADLNELASFIQKNERGSIVVAHQNVQGYPGMVLYLGMGFDLPKAKYELNLEWMCWGLDFYGDTLQESYGYQFGSLEELTNYLEIKYGIQVSDIPIKYKIDPSQFPNVLKDESQKHLFESTWKQFQQDFKEGAFLEPTLKLVYSSQDR